jgi:hypothetical protein
VREPAPAQLRLWLSAEEAFEALWLRPGAPLVVVRAAWRALVRLHHRDEVAMAHLHRIRQILLDDDPETASA